MRNARDTFLRFLIEHPNLAGITVHGIRKSKQLSETEFVQNNAINVEFSGFFFAKDNRQMVFIDVCNDDELIALDWAKKVADALRTAGYTPLFDYSTDPPVSVGGILRWEANTTISFRKIVTDDPDGYARLHTQLIIHHISNS
jgi:hypothetical protein